MSSLYNIRNEYLDLLESIDNDLGNIDENKLNQLDELDGDFNEKAKQYAYIVKKKDAENQYIDTEIKRLKKIKDSNTKLTDYLKDNLRISMKALDKKTLDFTTCKISIRKNPYAVSIDNEDIIQDKYKIEKTVISINKKEILNDIKSGLDVDGAHIYQNESIIIK